MVRSYWNHQSSWLLTVNTTIKSRIGFVFHCVSWLIPLFLAIGFPSFRRGLYLGNAAGQASAALGQESRAELSRCPDWQPPWPPWSNLEINLKHPKWYISKWYMDNMICCILTGYNMDIYQYQLYNMILMWYIYIYYMVPPQDLAFCGFYTGICSKLCTFWAYIFGCSFGSCFGWLVGGAIYIYIYK